MLTKKILKINAMVKYNCGLSFSMFEDTASRLSERNKCSD